jgi:hypothetical protein
MKFRISDNAVLTGISETMNASKIRVEFSDSVGVKAYFIQAPPCACKTRRLRKRAASDLPGGPTRYTVDLVIKRVKP